MGNILDDYKRYLEIERGLKDLTVSVYMREASNFISFLEEEGVRLEELTPNLLHKYFGTLFKEREPKKSTIALKVSSLRRFFEFLVKRGDIRDIFLYILPRVRREKKLPSFLREEEVLRLLEAPASCDPRSLRDRAILELLYGEGLRVRELASLNISDIDFKGRKLRVVGKGGKEREIPLGSYALRALRDYIENGRPSFLKRNDEALFLNKSGGRLSVRMIELIVKGYGKRAGIGKRIHPHILRHTFATHMLRRGADLRAVQELLGHSDLRSTEVYTHITPIDLKRSYEKAFPEGIYEDTGCKRTQSQSSG